MRAMTGKQSGLASRLASRLARRARSGQRGQALIEFAMTFVFLMLLLAGVADIGMLLDVHVALVYAARQGARTGAVIGAAPQADCAIVGAVHSALLNQPNLTVTQIVIYKATGTTNGRFTGTQPADIYPGNVDCKGGQIVDGNNNVVPQSGGNPWAYAQRSVAPFAEDSLAVEIDYTYQFQFNLLGSSFAASDAADSTMNPQGIATPVPTPTP